MNKNSVYMKLPTVEENHSIASQTLLKVCRMLMDTGEKVTRHCGCDIMECSPPSVRFQEYG